MEQSHEKLTGSQLVKNSRISGNLMVHYCVYKCPPPVAILSQINPVHSPIILSEDPSNITLPSTSGFSKWSLLSGFPTKTLYTVLLSSIRGISPAHLILLDFMTRIRFGVEYRSLNSSLCSFLHSSVTSSFWSKYLPQHPALKNPEPMLLPQCERPSFTLIHHHNKKWTSTDVDM